MNTICYLFIFVFEQFISFLYFKSKYILKRDSWIILLFYSISFIFQYSINLFNIPYLNLISFLICNLSIVSICFNTTFKQSLFNVVLLEGIMITTEIVVMYLFSSILEVDLLECKNNDLIIFLETAATKTLYFIIAYIISKFSKKNNTVSSSVNRYSVLLFFMPVSSIIVISSYAYLSFNYEINRTTNILFTCSSLIMLVSNIIIFIIHEKIIDVLVKNTELELEKQKTQINKEYYSELEKQYNSSNILIHDIKRCLLNIKDLSYNNDNQKIIEYINSIYEGYEIKKLRQYSNNKLLNLIISRYDQICYEYDIIFNVDIRNVDFSSINDSDLTGLFGNLLDNSLEAAKNSLHKQIDLVVYNRNEKYTIIELVNTSDNKPQKKGNMYISSKKSTNVHGFGLKSVARIIKRYDGYLKCTYNDELKTFKIVIIFKQN